MLDQLVTGVCSVMSCSSSEHPMCCFAATALLSKLVERFSEIPNRLDDDDNDNDDDDNDDNDNDDDDDDECVPFVVKYASVVVPALLATFATSLPPLQTRAAQVVAALFATFSFSDMESGNGHTEKGDVAVIGEHINSLLMTYQSILEAMSIHIQQQQQALCYLWVSAMMIRSVGFIAKACAEHFQR